MLKRFLPALALGLALAACSDDESALPSVVTEMADVATDGSGLATQMLTDGGRLLRLDNPQQTKYPNVAFRLLCNYALTGEDQAHLYGSAGVHILRDSIPEAGELPLSIVSAWQTQRYVNLHLSYRYATQSHNFSFTTDSVSDGLAYLTLHHLPCDDEDHYTGNAYASIIWDSLATSHIMINNTYEFQR